MQSRLPTRLRSCHGSAAFPVVPTHQVLAEPCVHDHLRHTGGSVLLRFCHGNGWPSGTDFRRCRPLCRVTPYSTAASESSTSSAGQETSSTEGPSTSAPASARPSAVSDVFQTRNGRRWRIRPYDNRDYSTIVDVQTESFHTSNPVSFLNDFNYRLFRAEVVDAMKQKTRFLDSIGDTFQLLVAEEVPAADLTTVPSSDTLTSSSSSSSGDDSGRSGSNSSRVGASPVIGSVEVTRMSERGVLAALPRDTAEYVYISSMCVKPSLRRRGAAQALLAAAEAQARLWRQPHLALHVYKDNTAAVQLYSSWGMRVVSSDPEWKKLLGDRVRLLMHKELVVASEETDADEAGAGAVPGAKGAADGAGASAQLVQLVLATAALTGAVGYVFATGTV